MRMPRIRFTIGGLMVAVLVMGVVLWGVTFRLTIGEQQALAAYQQARRVREVAEYDLKDYEESDYLSHKTTYDGQVALAKSNQERAIDRLKWSTEMFAKGKVSKAINISDQLAKQQADFDLEQAQAQLKVLEKYTRDKQLKSLRSDLGRARAVEQSKLASYRLEQARRWRIPGL